MSTLQESPRPPRPRRGWIKPLCKWTLFLLVAAAVTRQALLIWQHRGLQKISVTPGWLFAAAVVSLVGWTPCLVYWNTLLRRAGDTIRQRDVVRAYFVGHLGKYVPGKALSLVMRAMLLKGRGGRAATTVLTSTEETLANMAVGSCLVAVLGPWLIDALPADFPLPRLETAHARWLCAALAALCSIVPFHLFSLVMAHLAVRLTTPAGQVPAASLAYRPKLAESARTLVWLSCGWWLQGMSLGLCVAALSGTLDWNQWPLWTGAVSLATVGGFVAVFAPAGLFVREAAIVALLSSQIGEEQALVAAVLLRGVNLAGEILAAGALYYGVQPSSPERAG